MTHHLGGGSTPLSSRYLRPDASRYVRPDGARFIRPDIVRILAPGTILPDVLPRTDLKYRADQRRIPAGQPGGGRWADMLTWLIWGVPPSSANDEQDDDGDEGDDEEDDEEGGDIDVSDDVFRNAYAGAGDEVVVSDGDFIPSDTTEAFVDAQTQDTDPETGELIRVGGSNSPILNEFGEPYYKSGGHHEMPRAVYEKWDLAPETRRVFGESTTGSLPKDRMPVTPNGELRGHFWDRAHREYNDAVSDLSDKFFRENDIMETRRMTPDQARDLLKEIRESDEPKIRDFNRAMRSIGRIFRSGSGRGNQ
ncbi:hypothetical protein E0H22_10535 [Rhodopseudomonas boonkerdii]|uniref:hypothetical protein n=1 Tax=Rhodopseudomonas boonkerdii TaxID=475937 RepID=UPI001E2D2413|nr:hypothetical protein [Rhodopseudomonas boonkerdii]UGV26087.1 hypothetical protein E0H22_10535 [Rhodopseudomonas boonkerdii]